MSPKPKDPRTSERRPAPLPKSPTRPPDAYDVGAHDEIAFDSAPGETEQPKKEGDQ